MAKLTLEQIEQLQLNAARNSFIEFARAMKPDLQITRPVKAIASLVQKIESAEITRAVVEMPPRTGKSEFCSWLFPSWFLGRDPKRQVIQTTYNDDFARDFGRKVRGYISSAKFQQIFPHVTVDAAKNRSKNWRTSAGGEYIASGLGGVLTGKGANLFVIDDPFKSEADADRKAKRDEVFERFSSSIITRLMPGGQSRILIVLTRWHEDDLAGRLIKMGEEGLTAPWTRLKIPALLDEGTEDERPFDSRWTLEELREKRATMLPRHWSALYQQDPSPDTGEVFKPEWIVRKDRPYRPTESPPMNVYMASDMSASAARDADYTEHAIIGFDDMRQVWVLDWWTGRCEPAEWINAAMGLIKRYKPLCWYMEKGPITRATMGAIRVRMREENAMARIEEIGTNRSSKLTRSVPLQAWMSQGRVFFTPGKWMDGPNGLESQLLRFPGGQLHDDKVDALGLFLSAVDRSHGAIAKKRVLSTEPEHESRDPWGRRRIQAGGWKTV